MSAQSNSVSSWKLSVDSAGIAELSFDKLAVTVNTLSLATMQELDARLSELERMQPKAVVISSAKPNGFIAGADIKEFTEIKTPADAYPFIRAGQNVFDRLENLRCPTVAAINGFALGGGLELALACKYRVAASDANVNLGFPEIKLGIHPGFGGTVRAVQLIGPLHALDLILTGRSLRADQALAVGLVDRLAPLADLLPCARKMAMNPPQPHRPSLVERLANLGLARPLIAAQLQKRVARSARRAHYPAPYSVLELWKRFGAKSPEAFEAEARSMAELICTGSSRNLVRVFLLQDRLKALGSNGQFKARSVHVVGAGVMGGDIATWCASRGLNVSLQDRTLEQITPALKRANEFFARKFKEPSQQRAAAARLVADVNGEHVSRADVVIEAIFEDARVKKELYARLEPKLKPDAVLATNTSSLMLEVLTDELNDPARLVGLHFFNPVARMPLVEITHASATRPDVVDAALAFTRQLDKLPLPCRSAPGFVVNRILMPYINEAVLAAEQGIPLEVIDQAATDFGMPMGPIELVDTVGLDVALHVGKILASAFAKPAPASLDKLVAEKKLGKKSGQGFYVWQDGKPQKSPVHGAQPADLQDRLILAMVNEAVAVLREGIVEDADLVDAGAIFGTGFAPFRGGPLRYAQERGINACMARLEELALKHGDHLRPDPGWLLLR